MSYVEQIEFGNKNYDDDSTNVVNSEVLVDDCLTDSISRVRKLDEHIPRLADRIEGLEAEIKRTSDILDLVKVVRSTLEQERTMLNNMIFSTNKKEN